MLSVKISDTGMITIKLPKSDLVRATVNLPALESYHLDEYLVPKITDSSKFANEVYNALLDEDEEGSNLVHLMFDKAIINAVESGAEGIVFPEDKEYYEVVASKTE